VLVAIAQLKAELIAKGEATELFGQLRGDGLAPALATIEQGSGAAGGTPDQRQHLGGAGAAGGEEPAGTIRADGAAGAAFCFC
jgi:hypothetical protein